MNNEMTINPGALVTVMNASDQQRMHYYIDAAGKTPFLPKSNVTIHILQPDAEIAQALLGRMVGEEVFHRHNLVIEHITYPELQQQHN